MHEWFKGVRQGRFDPTEQHLLDKLLTFQIRYYERKRSEERTKEHDKLTATAIDQQSKKIEKEVTARAGQHLINSIVGRLPKIIVSAYQWNFSGQVGLAYDGCTREPKEKCPMCKGTYLFPEGMTAFPGDRNWGVGEAANPSDGTWLPFLVIRFDALSGAAGYISQNMEMTSLTPISA